MMSMQKVKVRGQRSGSQRSWPHEPFPDCNSSLNSHITMKWCSKHDVALKGSYLIVLQGHPSNFRVTRLKNRRFWPKLGFSDSNSRLNSRLAMKWCAKVEAAYERCPIVFQGHTSIFKVTRYKKIANFYPNWAFPDCNSSLNICLWFWNTVQNLM